MSSPTSTQTDNTEPTPRLLKLLERVRKQVAELHTGEFDERLFQCAMMELPDDVQSFADGFFADLKECQEVRSRVDVPAKRQKFFLALESDEEEKIQTRNCIIRARAQVRDTEVIVDGLFKITSSRAALDAVEDATARKCISRALTKTTVFVGKISEGLEELGKILVLFDTSGLAANVGGAQIAGRTGYEAVDPNRSRRQPKTEDGSGSGQTERVGLRSTAEAQIRIDEPSGRVPTAAVVEEPSANPALPNGVEANTTSSPQAAVAVAEREPDEEQAESVPSAKAPPEPTPTKTAEAATPPAPEPVKGNVSPRDFRRFQAALSRWAKWHPLVSSHLASSVGVVEADVEAAVEVKLDAWWSERANDAASESEHDGLRPRTTLKKVDYSGELPLRLFSMVSGEQSRARTLGNKNGVEVLIAGCLEEVSQRTSTQGVAEAASAFYATPATKKDPESETTSYDHLLRSRLEFSTVPVLYMKCGFKDPSHPKAAYRFDAWLYGNEQKLWFRRVPKQWTWKATAWAAAFAVAGLPLGYLLSRLF